MTHRMKDSLLAAFLILLGVSAYWYAGTFPDHAAQFPGRLAIIIAILGAVLLFRSYRRTDGAAAEKTLTSPRIVVVLTAAIAIYIPALGAIGYVPATILLMIAIMRCLGYRNTRIAFLVSTGSTLATFAIFRVLLGVPLPLGAVFFG